ncbi:hypothetical protein VN97_g4605 [Penicillium thymicola]|uniref:Uncharacterized protein n=1 Tax=Penicillium thymicola TaxID=293382 RepID=A0AAI9X9H3_PENTH|nr:hypothetical protein VN97_g4605 [Penicillium thymicola]
MASGFASVKGAVKCGTSTGFTTSQTPTRIFRGFRKDYLEKLNLLPKWAWPIPQCAWLACQTPNLYPYRVLIRGLCETEELPPRADLGNIIFWSAMSPCVGGPKLNIFMLSSSGNSSKQAD